MKPHCYQKFLLVNHKSQLKYNGRTTAFFTEQFQSEKARDTCSVTLMDSHLLHMYQKSDYL